MLLLEKVCQVYFFVGVCFYILMFVMFFLNICIVEYFNMLFDGNIIVEWLMMDVIKKGEYCDKFNISVQKKGLSKLFQIFFGGEKWKVCIVCFLVLQDLVSNWVSKNIDLFIGDEIDDVFDIVGFECFMGILEFKVCE